MLARHIDQENAVHQQQRAAAGKALGAKTPGARAPKTPFKASQNDENALKTGKIGAKTLGGGLKDGKPQLDKSSFVTPAGPRNRAPLGFKTANAKAFQTPGPIFQDRTIQKSQQKTLSPRLRRAKVKVHQETEQQDEEEEDVPDIEYMPPRPIPLPDLPSDDEGWGPDKDLSHITNESLLRGWRLAQQEESSRKHELKMQEMSDREEKLLDAMCERAMDDCMADIEREMQEELGISPKKPATTTTASSTSTSTAHTTKKAKPQVKKAALSTMSAKSAASVLSQKPSSSQTLPSYAAPTVSSAKARAPSSQGLFGKKIREESGSTGRHETALAASRSTLGYGKGRAVSHNLRSPVASAFASAVEGGGGTVGRRAVSGAAATVLTAGGLDNGGGAGAGAGAMSPTPSRNVKSAAQLLREMEEEIRERELQIESDPDNDSRTSILDLLADDDGLDDFQFPVPEE